MQQRNVLTSTSPDRIRNSIATLAIMDTEAVTPSRKAGDLKCVNFVVHGDDVLTLYLDKSADKCVKLYIRELKAEFLRKLRQATAAPFFSVRGCDEINDVSPENLFDAVLGSALVDDRAWLFVMQNPSAGIVAINSPRRTMTRLQMRVAAFEFPRVVTKE